MRTQQFTQHREGIDDEFTLGDLKWTIDFGTVGLTSITSYTDRDVVVLRDATQLTGSVTIDLGGTAAEARINSPLFDRTKLHVVQPGIAAGFDGDEHLRVARRRFLSACRPRTTARTCRRPATTRSPATVGIRRAARLQCAAGHAVLLATSATTSSNIAAFGEAPSTSPTRWRIDRRPALLRLQGRPRADFRRASSPTPTPPGGMPGIDGFERLLAARAS